MSITPLRALYVCNPQEARRQIMDRFDENDGSMKATAAALGVTYVTLFRLIKEDKELSDGITKKRMEQSDKQKKAPGNPGAGEGK